MKPPREVKELQMFLGFVNYFVIYLPFFTQIIKPLYRLISKDTVWPWDPIEAHEICILAFESAPILGHPQDGRRYPS